MTTLDRLNGITAMQASIVESMRRLDSEIQLEAIVIGGAALQMHGIRVARAVDTVVTPETFDLILHDGLLENPVTTEIRGLETIAVAIGAGQKIDDAKDDYRGDITFMPPPNDKRYRAAYEELRSEASPRNGVLVSPVQRLLDWKRALNRVQDDQDIELLKIYLGYYRNKEPELELEDMLEGPSTSPF